MSVRQNVRSAKRPFGKTSVGKCPFGKMSFGKMSFGKVCKHTATTKFNKIETTKLILLDISLYLL
jgi:hypothetical protein